jgi:hypothetical protein
LLLAGVPGWQSFVLDGRLGIEPRVAMIAVALALAKAVVWDRVIILPVSFTMISSLSVTQDKFRHPLIQVNSKVSNLSVCAQPVGQGCDVVGHECNVQPSPLNFLYLSVPHPSQSQLTIRNHQSTNLPLPQLFVSVRGQLMAVLLR